MFETEPRNGDDWTEVKAKKCNKCKSPEHTKKSCPELMEVKIAAFKATTCYKCGSLEHLKRDCPVVKTKKAAEKVEGRPIEKTDDNKGADETKDKPETKTCSKCGSPGHLRKACPVVVAEKASHRADKIANARCYNCAELGHLSKDCTAQKCRRCHEFGHVQRQCTIEVAIGADGSQYVVENGLLGAQV
ncbi:zinc knuckle transcription factor [Seiridium cupressi]